METEKDKRKRQIDDEEPRREKKSKRQRSRSRSPAQTREKDSRRKRRYSRSRSPEKSLKKEKEQPKDRQAPKEAPQRKNTETDMLNTRTGGAYIPPARLRMMQAQITDKSSVAYQRLAWEALKKSIHGHINKINVGNIGIIIKQLLRENIVRGRGLLCRSVIQAQAASPTFTNVYAALVAAVNSRFPNIGELLLKRLVIQFKRGFKRNDKPICISSASFIAHLVNQRVAHEILALELLTLLVESPTDDSVEVSISFLKECGQKLTEVSSKGVNAIFEMLRNILHEGQLDKRVQYMIEVMFQVWKDGFKDHPALIEELELVPEEEQFTHLLMLDDATDPQDILNVFKHDEKYEENEQKYKTLSKEILGSDDDSDDGDGEEESGSEESDEEDQEQGEKPGGVTIIDNTETNLVALRRTIYLTINSSLDFEECAHKLMKMQLKPGQEVELCHMFLDCCAEQRTYEKFYGLLAQRFCNINRIYIGPFEEIFKDSYSTAHRLDTNRLRNVSKFFAHLLFTDSISWEVLHCVRLNEEDTTSSSRIYIKILFQELAEYMGLKKLNDRLKDPTLQDAFSGVFPRDNPKNTRFSINFFTSIGLGGLTDELREHLKQLPKNLPPPVTEIKVDSDSSDSSSSSSSSSDSSSSDSEEDKTKSKKKKKTKSNEKENEDESSKSEAEKSKERWGHDGFYDTYGKDARRAEPEQNKRDKDNFFIPRDVARKPDQGWGRNDQREVRDDRRDDRGERRGDRGERPEDRGERRENRGERREDRSERPEYRGERREDKSGRREERIDRREDRGNKREERGDRTEKEDNNQEREERVDRRAERGDKRYERGDKRDRRDEREDKRDRREERDKRYEEDDKREYRTDRMDKDDRRRDDFDKNTGKTNDQDRRDRYESRNKNPKDKQARDESSRRRDDRRAKDTGYESEEDDREARRNRERSKRDKKEKENRKDKRDKRKDSDSDSDDTRRRKYDERNGIDLDEWDIRGNSIRRETPGRYWDIK